eukprot:m.192929 g.192929  ORF g.192929 m.192929 type:complete len:80 (-) comp16776_c2_seq1:147-386(-)
MEGIDGALGTLVFDFNGTIVQSSGELKDGHKVAQVVLSILKECRLVLKGSFMRRIEVASGAECFLITVANDNVYVVKKN